jgi:hypothetical protein
MEQLRAIGALARALAALVFALPETAGATTYAPVNRAGPRLSVPAAKLAAALKCDGPLAGAAHPPVLLVPGATLNPTTDFSYGWEPALRQLGYPYCTIDLPGNAMADVQTAGEYVVYAIRTMHAAYGGRIDIIGHSQGGMVPRWALRFWPGTRAMVDDLIGLSPSNHGTLDAIPLCDVGCAASIWQQRSNAKFIAALNSRQETFAGVSYTEVYTLTDEVVVPNFGRVVVAAHRGRGDHQRGDPDGVPRRPDGAHRHRDLRRHRLCAGRGRDHPSRARRPRPHRPDRLPGSADAGHRPGGLPGQLRQDERRGRHDADHLSARARRAPPGLLRHGDVPAVLVAAPPCPKWVGKPRSSRAKIPLSVCLPYACEPSYIVRTAIETRAQPRTSNAT